jgi:four helix bundle protein
MNVRSSKLKVQSSRKAPETGSEIPAVSVWRENEYGSCDLELKEDSQAPTERHPWDLEERTAIFGESIVRLSKKVPHNPTNNRLIDQLVGAGTSVGANYCEANEAVSAKDFRHNISRCMKEAKETKFFLRMVVASEPRLADEARPLFREAHELLRIFGAMRRK